MSLAGVDPTESNGIPGNATNVRQLETVVERVESPQEKRQEIAHTNIRMGLDVLFRQFIYIGTYTWKTSDAPGKVIATFPIHPSACNEYTDHTYQMFNTWVGGQKARIRIIGTAFYGGGLFFVRVPPNFTQAQIDSMSLSGFTAFPHSDMDPKNLSSIDMDLQDYRAGHFHSGDLDLSDPNSFAGYLVIVVNARLVTQSADIHQLDLRVEMAGNYQFQVPRPIRQKQAEVTGPLSDASTTLNNLFGCDDVICNPYLNHLVSLAKTVTSYTQGSVFHRALGGDWFYTKANTSTVGTADLSRWWTDAENARKSKDDGTFSGYGNFTIRTSGDALYVNAPSQEPTPAPKWNQCNYLVGAWYTSNNKPKEAFQIEDFNFTQNTLTIGGGGQGAGTSNEGTIYADAVASGFSGAIDNASTFYKANDSDPNVPDESLVILVTNNGASVSTQAKQWGDDLKTFSGWPAGDAALYELYDTKSGVIVSYLKLRKNGFMYSNPVTADVSFGLNCKLRFSQWIPEKEPIPPAPKFTNLALNAAIDKAVQKAEAKILRKSAHHERSR